MCGRVLGRMDLHVVVACSTTNEKRIKMSKRSRTSSSTSTSIGAQPCCYRKLVLLVETLWNSVENWGHSYQEKQLLSNPHRGPLGLTSRLHLFIYTFTPKKEKKPPPTSFLKVPRCWFLIYKSTLIYGSGWVSVVSVPIIPYLGMYIYKRDGS